MEYIITSQIDTRRNLLGAYRHTFSDDPEAPDTNNKGIPYGLLTEALNVKSIIKILKGEKGQLNHAIHRMVAKGDIEVI